MSSCVVLTTINEPGTILDEWLTLGHDVIVVGDKRTPETYRKLPLTFLDVSDQEKRFPDFARSLPFNHYSRKNIGYLHAIKEGFTVIAETDDDNYPLPGWPGLSEKSEPLIVKSPQYPNIYKLFTNQHIWPRGFPLDKIGLNEEIQFSESPASEVLVWQGLVNGDPDVDAIYRLTSDAYNKLEFIFDDKQPVILDEGVLCPFNTQNTIWCSPRSFPYLYLPSTVSFRATDIIKSYVAQFCIWAIDGRVGFTGPNAVQERNDHDLVADLKSELSLYTDFYRFMDSLKSVAYTGSPQDLYLAYQALAGACLVEQKELKLVEKWLRIIEGA